MIDVTPHWVSLLVTGSTPHRVWNLVNSIPAQTRLFASKVEILTAMYFFLFCLSLCMSHGYAWMCGDSSQCTCYWSGLVTCFDTSRAPYFPARARRGRELELRSSGAFDLVTLDNTYGFQYVTFTADSVNTCVVVTRLYPWIRCSTVPIITSRRTTRNVAQFDELSTVTEMSADDKTTNTGIMHADIVARDPSGIKDSSSVPLQLDNNTTTTARPTTVSTFPAWILGIVVFGAFVSIVCCSCILVSLLNFHERINLHTHSQDDPICAVYCCKVLLALCIYPMHLCATLCKCNWRNLRTLNSSTETLYMGTL